MAMAQAEPVTTEIAAAGRDGLEAGGSGMEELPRPTLSVVGISSGFARSTATLEHLIGDCPSRSSREVVEDHAALARCELVELLTCRSVSAVSAELRRLRMARRPAVHSS